MEHTLFRVSVYDGDKPVAMARLLGDMGLNYYIKDVAVKPEYQKKGIGSMMRDEAVRLARYSNKKAVRLDALASNTPARHMYETKGFEYRGKLKLYADNTGLTDFCFYEYQL